MDQLISPVMAWNHVVSDALGDIVEECGRILDESLGILSDVELDLNSAREDTVVPAMTRADLQDMAHEVADSARIRRAESSFVRRHLGPTLG